MAAHLALAIRIKPPLHRVLATSHHPLSHPGPLQKQQQPSSSPHQRLGQPAEQLGLVYGGDRDLVECGGRSRQRGAVARSLRLQLLLRLQHQRLRSGTPQHAWLFGRSAEQQPCTCLEASTAAVRQYMQCSTALAAPLLSSPAMTHLQVGRRPKCGARQRAAAQLVRRKM